MNDPGAFSQIITQNPTMLSLFDLIESVAPSGQPILITGETGVGKELIAKTIHRVSRLGGDLITVNVAGLDGNLFADTLFGHTKGAYSGADYERRGLIEKASQGTLFLDEIGDLDQSSQVKLLRLLQEGEYLPLGCDEVKKAHVRIIAATNRDLWLLQREGHFRQDLNFRLRTHHIHIPPLRERLDDLSVLLPHFLEKSALQLNKKCPRPPKELLTLLETYTFPGNVRELEAMIFDAISRHKAMMLSLDTFLHHIQSHRQREGQSPSPALENNLIAFPDELPTIKQATQILIREALKRAKGNQTIAAGMLGITRQALSKRLKGDNSNPL